MSWLTGSKTQLAPYGQNTYRPNRQPDRIPQGRRPTSFPPSSQSTTISPQNLPLAVLNPMLACTQREPDNLKPWPQSKKAEIGGWWETCSAYIQQPSRKAWKVYPIVGLQDLSTSTKRIDRERITALKAFMRSMGSLRPVSMRGARLRHRQQVQRMPQGFIANTGKLIPMKEPVEMNLEMRYLMILGCMLFFSSLMNNRPPRFSSRCQSLTLQQVQYSTTQRFSYSYFFLCISLSLSYQIRLYISADSSCDLSYFCLLRIMLALDWQLTILGFCIFCYLTSQQLWKNCHSLQASTALLNLLASALISYVLFSIFKVSTVSASVVTTLQSNIALKGIFFFFWSLSITKAILCPSMASLEGSQSPRYLDLI